MGCIIEWPMKSHERSPPLLEGAAQSFFSARPHMLSNFVLQSYWASFEKDCHQKTLSKKYVSNFKSKN